MIFLLIPLLLAADPSMTPGYAPTRVTGSVTLDGGYVTIQNSGTSQAVPVQCVKADGTGFESCAGSSGGGGGNLGWVGVDGGTIAVSNFPATQPVSIASMPTTAVTNSNLDVALSTRTKPSDQQHVIVDTIPSTAVTNSGLTNLDVALSTRTKPADQQHVIIDTIPSTAVTNSGLTNLDVALSTRTKPADQQHTIIDSSASIAVTGPLTDTQLRATPLPISGTVTASGPLTDTQLRNSAVPVSLSSMPSTPVTGVFWQTTQPVSVATMPTTPISISLSPLTLPTYDPFTPRCNAVRRINCK